MRITGSLNQARWECKYQVVLIPKYRKKLLFGQIRKYLREVFHRFAKQYVSTEGRDGQLIRKYIRHQDKEDRRVDKLNLA